jgi:hypothetical protein
VINQFGLPIEPGIDAVRIATCRYDPTNQPIVGTRCGMQDPTRHAGHGANGGIDPPGVGPMQSGEFHHSRRDELPVEGALEVAETPLNDVQTSTGGHGELINLVCEPADVPQRCGTHALLDHGTGFAIGIYRHQWVDESGTVDLLERFRKGAVIGTRGMGQKEPVEFPLSLLRKFARLVTALHILLNFIHHLSHVHRGVSRAL